jgi:hypothetical protein
MVCQALTEALVALVAQVVLAVVVAEADRLILLALLVE